ncbi:MAG: hypothetical protein VW455_08990 [Nitrospinota bacterium]
MQLLRLLALTLFCLIGTFQNHALAESKADEVLDKLDQGYYFPQESGLTKLKARIQWEQLDVASGSGKFLRNPDFIFQWMKNSGAGIRNFKILADKSKYSAKRRFELKNQIENYGEMIIPFTLKQKFSSFRSRLGEKARGRLGLLLKPESSDQSVVSYHLLINEADMKIETIRFRQRSAPYKVSARFNYEKLDGKWIISESNSRFSMGELDYDEKTTYRYKKFGDIWLVHRIDQILKQENTIFQSHRFKISDVRATY